MTTNNEPRKSKKGKSKKQKAKSKKAKSKKKTGHPSGLRPSGSIGLSLHGTAKHSSLSCFTRLFRRRVKSKD
jgi:hypothetical protein